MSPNSFSDLPLEIVQDILQYVVVPPDLPFLARLRLVCKLFSYEVFVALEATSALLTQGLMGCRPEVEYGPVPFLARYLQYRISRPLSRSASGEPTIETHLKWILEELLEPTAGHDEKYAALLALCHHINEFAAETALHFWGGNPGWYVGITQSMESLTAPAYMGTVGGAASLLPAAITLGLDAIYDPIIAAIEPPEEDRYQQPQAIWITVGSHTVNYRCLCLSFGSPLYAAVKARKPNLVRRILASGLDVNTRYCNPVASAARNHDMDMLDLLLEPQYHPNSREENVVNAFAVCATLGKTAVMDRVLKRANDIGGHYQRSTMGSHYMNLNRALLRAVYGNHVDTVEFLLNEGAQFPTLFTSPDHGRSGPINEPTVVEVAAWRGNADILRNLLSRNAMVSIQVVQAAVVGNHVEILRILLAHKYIQLHNTYSWWSVLSDGANLDCTDALVYLISEARVLDIPSVLSGGDDVEAVYLSGVAGTLCSRGNYRAVEALIQAGLPVDHNCTLDPDDDGEPGDGNATSLEMKPMDLAMRSLAPGAAETVQMLARYGASAAPKRTKQYLPYDWKSLMPQSREIQPVIRCEPI
ncbi:OPT family small oligopeptide transporter [Apiospora arundinis]